MPDHFPVHDALEHAFLTALSSALALIPHKLLRQLPLLRSLVLDPFGFRPALALWRLWQLNSPELRRILPLPSASFALLSPQPVAQTSAFEALC